MLEIWLLCGVFNSISFLLLGEVGLDMVVLLKLVISIFPILLFASVFSLLGCVLILSKINYSLQFEVSICFNLISKSFILLFNSLISRSLSSKSVILLLEALLSISIEVSFKLYKLGLVEYDAF